MICWGAKIYQKNVSGVNILELHKIGHENLCAFSEISSGPVCAIINDRSLIASSLSWNVKIETIKISN